MPTPLPRSASDLSAMEKPSAAKLTESTSSNLLSGLAVPRDTTSTGKRRRALSEEADHGLKRHTSSTPGIRAQSVAVDARTAGAVNSQFSQGGLRSTTTNGKRDSGFHEDRAVDFLDDVAGLPVSRDGDAGFQDTASRSSGLSSIKYSDGNDTRRPAQQERGSSVTITTAEESAGIAQVTKTDKESHDALGDDHVEGQPTRPTDTVYALSEETIVVSSHVDRVAQESIVPSRAEAHAINVQPRPPKRSRGGANQEACTVAKTSEIHTVDHNAASGVPKASITVPGGSYEGGQTIHANSQGATAENNATAAAAQDDQEYTVSHITAHRTVGEGNAIELLVHWDEATTDNAPTWELEENLQEGALDAVADYWSSVKGGRAAVRPYEVYLITGHKWLKKGKSKTKSLYLEVEWLGYKEKSMEPARRFAQDQPQLLQDYFESIGGRPKPAQ